MTREQAVARVKKLLALQQDEHATPAERATALEIAQRLVEEFSIQEHEVVAQPRAPQPSPSRPKMTVPLDPNLRAIAEQVIDETIKGAAGRVFTAVMQVQDDAKRKEWVAKFMKGLFNE